MPKHLVTMLVGRVVEADTPDGANRLAVLPLQHGLLPGLVGISLSGMRLAEPEDENGSIQNRIDTLAHSRRPQE